MVFAFLDCELDSDGFELRCKGRVVPVEPQVFVLLRHLILNRHRAVTKEELFETVWEGRVVSDSALSSRIKAARRGIGDDGRSQSAIRTIHGVGFRFVAPVREVAPAAEAAAASEGGADGAAGDVLSIDEPSAVGPAAERQLGSLGALARTAGSAAPLVPASLHQEIRFTSTADGVRIAWASIGEGRPIVKAANWMSHLDYEWESPIWRHWLSGLARRHRLIRYDERGNGLSDRDCAITFEAMVADLEAVVEAAGVERFALFGISQGAAVSVAYAVRHPERVSHIILYGGYVKGWRARGDPGEIARREAMITLVREGWGQNNPAFRQLFTSRFCPGATREQADWFNELQRITVSPANAAHLLDICGDIDVSALLADVQAPTLVLHARDDASIPLEAGRAFATGIPQARFVTLESSNHVLLEGEPAFDRLLGEVERFLAT